MFNLVRDPWIPIFKSKSELVSLRGIFKDLSKIDAIEGTSIEKISIIRLLICITQAALKGPDTEKTWKACKDSIVPKALKYLKKWEHRFDLYGKNAFLQMPWLPKLKNKSVDNLRIFYPSGENHTLFDHEASRAGRALPDDELALALLLTQAFGVGGLQQFPEFSWLGKKIPHLTSPKATPINNILLTIIMGENLLDTVHANLIPTEWLSDAKIKMGQPIWEYCKSITHKGKDYQEIQCTYMGNLISLTRGIVLYPGEALVTMVDGIPSIGFPAYREPMATLKTLKTTKKKKNYDKPYLPALVDKAGWRELESILSLPTGGVGHEGVWAFRHLLNQMDSHPAIIVLVAGFATYQAKKEGVLEWVFLLPKGFLGMGAMLNYKQFVETAEECYRSLRKALWLSINSERKKNKPGNKDRVLDMMESRASSEYWPKMEGLALKALEGVTQDWKQNILKEARDTFNRACPSISLISKVKGLKLLF